MKQEDVMPEAMREGSQPFVLEIVRTHRGGLRSSIAIPDRIRPQRRHGTALTAVFLFIPVVRIGH